MTVTQRKPQSVPDEIQFLHEPGVNISCDACSCDLTHSIRIKCADPVCVPGEGVDICPSCFCAGKEFARHKRGHAYRVIEMHSYPIFTEDWGADEELLLLTGVTTHGVGNWKKIAEHIGTRTKEEVEEHYRTVYVESPNWPLPRMDLSFDIDPDIFHERKRRRIAEMNQRPTPKSPAAPTSAPANHEISGYLPGRLEFETEHDNDAEDLVKDLEFGLVYDFGGEDIIQDPEDSDLKARQQIADEKQGIKPSNTNSGKGPMVNGSVNGQHVNGDMKKIKQEEEEEEDEPVIPQPFETPDSVKFKLTLLEMYFQRVEKREEVKEVIFDRGLAEDYKKMQAADRKRTREERELFNRLKPFARLQTSSDFEHFASDIIYEGFLRKRIQDLQRYRRNGLSTPADIAQFEAESTKRSATPRPVLTEPISNTKHASGRQSTGPNPRRAGYSDLEKPSRESTPRLGAPPNGPRRPPQPLNLANSPSLHLLTPAEQTLCSQLRIFPKPYLVIKETLVREYARRGGKLRRREARDLVKIDVNKTSRVWDFLVQAGYLKITNDPPQTTSSISAMPSQSQDASSSLSVNGSPQKDVIMKSPRPSMSIPPAMSATSSQNGSVYSASMQSVTQSWTPSNI